MAIALLPVGAFIDAPVVGLLAAGPPAFELSAAVCAIAMVPVNANAAANARVLSFMGRSSWVAPMEKTTTVRKVPAFHERRYLRTQITRTTEVLGSGVPAAAVTPLACKNSL